MLKKKQPQKISPKKSLQEKQNPKKLKKKGHISYSQIMNGRCLFKYKMINLLKEVSVHNEAMREGALVHHIIYDYTKKCVEAGMDADFELMNELIDKHFKKSKLSEKVYTGIRNPLLEFAERGLNFQTILDYEKRARVNIGTEKEPIWIEVVIDRVNSYNTEEGSVLEIIDYKNQMNIFTNQEFENDIQLQIYKYIAANYLYPGYDFVRVGVYHTRYNFLKWGPLLSRGELSKEFENTERFIIRQSERLLHTDDSLYLPEPGEACWEYQGCPVMILGKCPIYKAKDLKDLLTIDDKVRAVRKIDLDRKAILDKLKIHFKTAPPVDIDGKTVGFSPTIEYKFEMEKARSFALEIGAPLSGVTIPKTDLERAIKKIMKLHELDDDQLKIMNEAKIETASNSFKY